MCCFAQAVISVFATNIFARLSGNGTQYLVYQMQFASEEPNAMILPIPSASGAQEGDVNFIDLSEYEEFFEDLDRAFPSLGSEIACAMPVNEGQMQSNSIMVHKVGSFVASFVPGVDDFDRLDPQFTIPKETWSQIPQYDDYGFVVFQLDDLEGKPHPMAFEFKAREEQIFFPTVHIHDGEVHELEEFDHNLFLQHAGFDTVVDTYRGPRVRDQATKHVRSKGIAGEYCMTEKTNGILSPELLIHRKMLYGLLPNKDTIVKIPGDPLVPGFNFRQLHWIWPWAVFAAGIGWFFNRRSHVKRLRQQAADGTNPQFD
jgi:hypothetical protein